MQPCRQVLLPWLIMWWTSGLEMLTFTAAIGAGCLTSGADDSGTSSLKPFWSSWQIHVWGATNNIRLISLPRQAALQTHSVVCCPSGHSGQSPSTGKKIVSMSFLQRMQLTRASWLISPSGANIDCTMNLCLFFSLGSNLCRAHNWLFSLTLKSRLTQRAGGWLQSGPRCLGQLPQSWASRNTALELWSWSWSIPSVTSQTSQQ